MYLLMLLATFMSAIYGYNLSIRPDYDRDIPHKRALAVQFKFLHQHSAAKKVMLKVMRKEEGFVETFPFGVLPGDLFYTDDDESKDGKQAIYIKQRAEGGSDKSVLVRKSLNGVGDEEGSNIMRIGQTLYASDVMATQLVCPNKQIDEEDVEAECDVEKTEDGMVTGTCCGKGGGPMYLISYRVLDGRWLNRLTRQVNTDFMWAVSKREYSDNIGVVTWDDRLNSWVFTGKIKLYVVYRKDKEEFIKEHPNEMYPLSKTNKSEWTMPNKVFKKDFFKYMKGNQLKSNLCDNGCIVRIEEI